MKLAAAPTFRDIGGAVTREGSVVRHGLFFRAGHLLAPSQLEREFVRNLRLRQVFDLRSEAERIRQPSNWLDGDGIRSVHCDVNTDVRAGGAALLHLLEDDFGESGARKMMLHNYRHFPGAFSQQMRPLFEAMLDEQEFPVLIHCSAGKDRTGFACAMLLHALGVSEAGILADYLRTGDALQDSPLAVAMSELLAGYTGRTPNPAAIAVIMGVQREFLETAIVALREEYGSIDDYLEQVAGLDAQRRAQLRSLFLTPAEAEGRAT